MKLCLLWVAFGLASAAFGCGSPRGGQASDGAVGGAGNSSGMNGGATDSSGSSGAGSGAPPSGGASGAAHPAAEAGAETAGGARSGGGTAGADGGALPFAPLDLNDITILAPLPASRDRPILLRASDLADDGTGLVPQAFVDRLLGGGPFGAAVGTFAPFFQYLQLVAVRFDLCDRHLPGTCPEPEDARLRLVFQPLLDPSSAQDIGLHAFYVIRRDEIAGAVAELRELATLAPAQSGALRVSPALSAANPEPYAAALRAFVRRYGGESRLARLTMNARDLNFDGLAWTLRGLEKKADTFTEMAIPGVSESGVKTSEVVFFSGGSSYTATPTTDTPSGLQVALSQAAFERADATSQGASLAALAQVDDPLSTTAETVACVACHVSTVVLSARGASAGIDPRTLPNRYASQFELSTAAGMSAQTPQTLRALGYQALQPMISQRVVNETAQTLTEIEQRFPR